MELVGPGAIGGTARNGGERVVRRRQRRIEARFGRVRPYPNAPRTLDLDLLDLDGLVRQSPDPVLPHPRMAERAFVLLPLCDIAPGWMHPVLGLSAAELLARLGPQSVRLAG